MIQYIFIDESGTVHGKKPQRWKKYFVHAAFAISSSDFTSLEQDFSNLKIKHGYNPADEM